MTFDDLKALIVSRIKLQELCPLYQDLIGSVDYDDFINSATDSFEWAYQSGVFDDSLFSEIPEATLNGHSIYINDVTLTNPAPTGANSGMRYIPLAVFPTPVTTVGTSYEDMFSFTLRANTLSKNNQRLIIKTQYQFGGAGGLDGARFTFTPSTIDYLSASSHSEAAIEIVLIRVSSSTARFMVFGINNFTGTGVRSDLITDIDFAVDNDIILQAISATAGDVTAVAATFDVIKEPVSDNGIQTVYLFGGDSVINIDGSNKCRVRVLGEAGVTINATDNAFVDVKSFNSATVTINLDTNASALIEGTQQSAITVVCDDDSYINQVISDEATGDATMNNNSYGRVRCYNSSALNYLLNDSGDLNIQTFQKATVTTLAP